MNRLLCFICGLCLAAVGFGESGAMTLEQALELARKNSPRLLAAEKNTRAAEAAVAAAGRWINPQIELEAERLGGDFDVVDDAEMSVGLMQTFQLGGKQKKARAAARSNVTVAEWKTAEAETALDSAVRLAFMELAAQQEMAVLRTEQESIARCYLEETRQLAESGGASELALLEAEMALEEIVLLKTCCVGDIAAARARLASLIGRPVDEQTTLYAPDFYDLSAPANYAVNEMHPTLRRFEAEADSLRAQAEAARAGDAANVKVRAAYKHDRLESADSFTLGVGVPLTIHRKGRAEAAAAMLRAEAVMAGRAEADRRLREELAVLSATLDGAVLETKQIQDRLIPPAKKALDTVRAGLESGLYSQRDLTDTQAALAELRIRQVESLQAVHQLRAELERFASIEPGAAVRAPGGCSDPNCTGCRSHN